MCVIFSLENCIYLSISTQNACALVSSCLQCVVCRKPRAVVVLPLLGMLDGTPCGAGSCHASHPTHNFPSTPASLAGSMSEPGANFPAPSQRRSLIMPISVQFAAKNLLASSAEHLPIIPSRLFSPRTPRPAPTNTAQMGGFSHSQCRPGASTSNPLSISAH